MARTAAGLGHKYMALTDHSPRLTVANGLSRERRLQQLEVVAELNKKLADELDGFTILNGIEVDILDDGSLDCDTEILARLDIVVASVHSKLRMASEPMTERMVRAIANPHVDVLGSLHRPADHRRPRHPTGVGVRRRGGLRGMPPVRYGGRDQLPARTARPAEAAAVDGGRDRTASSRSTPTRTRPASSTGRSTAANEPRNAASRRTASSTPGTSRNCWNGRHHERPGEGSG